MEDSVSMTLRLFGELEHLRELHEIKAQVLLNQKAEIEKLKAEIVRLHETEIKPAGEALASLTVQLNRAREQSERMLAVMRACRARMDELEAKGSIAVDAEYELTVELPKEQGCCTVTEAGRKALEDAANGYIAKITERLDRELTEWANEGDVRELRKGNDATK